MKRTKEYGKFKRLLWIDLSIYGMVMDKKSYIGLARERIEKGHFYLSHHAQIERGKEKILVDDIVSAY